MPRRARRWYHPTRLLISAAWLVVALLLIGAIAPGRGRLSATGAISPVASRPYASTGNP